MSLVTAIDPETVVSEAGPSREPAWRRYLENRVAVAGLIAATLVALFCFAGPLVYHTDQVHPSLLDVDAPPGPGRPLGSDHNGYDMLGRLMLGGRLSLEIAFAVAVAVTVVGVLYGALSGYLGGRLDEVLMRIVDIGYAIPALFLFVFASRLFTPSEPLLIGVLALTVWFTPARLVRGESLSLRTREFVQAARSFGGSAAWIIARHLIPNTIGTIIVNATFQVADAIVAVATLEFLGFGIPPPTPTWGGTLASGAQFLQDGYWWEVFPPMAIITLTVVAFNYIGDALRDVFDVRLGRARR